jgi:hypothetical protein
MAPAPVMAADRGCGPIYQGAHASAVADRVQNHVMPFFGDEFMLGRKLQLSGFALPPRARFRGIAGSPIWRGYILSSYTPVEAR